MNDAIRRAAQAIRREDQRIVENRVREVEFADVKRVGPLALDLHDSSITLDEEDLTLSQWVRSYDNAVGIAPGDKLAVKKMRSGGWLVTDIVGSGREFREGAELGLPSGGSSGELLAKASATDGDVEWVAPAAPVAGVPTGSLTGFAGSSAPTGWLLCDGSAVSRSTYSDLFAVVGTSYGSGDGSTTFGLPDLRGRVAVGRDSGDTSFDALGETGGAKTVTLDETEIPAHTHGDGTLATDTDGYHRHDSGTYSTDSDTHSHTTYGFQATNTTATGGQNRISALTTAASANETGDTSEDTHSHDVQNYSGYDGLHDHDVTGSTGSTGGGGAHENLPPYQVMNYIIKT